jgi:hypothetical protein
VPARHSEKGCEGAKLLQRGFRNPAQQNVVRTLPVRQSQLEQAEDRLHPQCGADDICLAILSLEKLSGKEQSEALPAKGFRADILSRRKELGMLPPMVQLSRLPSPGWKEGLRALPAPVVSAHPHSNCTSYIISTSFSRSP